VNDPKPSAETSAATDEAAQGWTETERDAMKTRAQELKAAKRRRGKASPEEDESALLAKIAEMTPADRAMAERLHAIVAECAPDLAPKLWYGMPGYAKDGKILCFFQPAQKFKTRYATLGFNEEANLDDGEMWPVAFALTELSTAVEDRIVAIVKRAAS